MKINIIAKTPNPQQASWLAMHSCYTETSITEVKPPPEEKAGFMLVKHLLAGHKGHYSPLEANSITFACSGFPHSTIVQLRTHRIGCSWSVQSMRYTGNRIIILADPLSSKYKVEDLFYFREVGKRYTDREGNKYLYTQEMLLRDQERCYLSAVEYVERIKEGYAPEHARDFLVSNYIQDFVCTFNARSLMHVLDLRSKADAQLEVRQWAELAFTHFSEWMPAVADWYEANRLGKARLSP